MAGVAYKVSQAPGRVMLEMAETIRPAVRMTRGGKWTGEAREYISHQNALRDRVVLIMRDHGIDPFPRGARLRIHAVVTRRQLRGDIDNYAKGLIDALQGAMFPNDIAVWSLTIEKRKADIDRFTVTVEAMDEEPPRLV